MMSAVSLYPAPANMCLVVWEWFNKELHIQSRTPQIGFSQTTLRVAYFQRKYVTYGGGHYDGRGEQAAFAGQTHA